MNTAKDQLERTLLKVEEGIDDAACGLGTIQDRLYAAINIFCFAPIDRIPDYLAVEGQAILAACSTVKAEDRNIWPTVDGKKIEGGYQATCVSMEPREAAAMMRRIIEWRGQMASALEALERGESLE